ALGIVTFLGTAVMGIMLPQSRRFQKSNSNPLIGIRLHLTNRKMWAAFAVGFFWLFNFVGLFNYIVFYLADEPFSLSPGKTSLLFLTYLAGAFVSPLAGRWVKQIGYTAAISWTTLLAMAGIVLTGVQSI